MLGFDSFVSYTTLFAFDIRRPEPVSTLHGMIRVYYDSLMYWHYDIQIAFALGFSGWIMFLS